jgi:hypothetical protein
MTRVFAIEKRSRHPKIKKFLFRAKEIRLRADRKSEQDISDSERRCLKPYEVESRHLRGEQWAQY